jgi:hypothetical protein
VAAVSVAVFAVAAVAVIRGGQQGQGQAPSQFPLSNPIRERGSSVTGAYEGWYRNKDGGASLLVGYFNRNTKQELDIPIGPNNRIEPGGPDQGQPTHFLASRQWGVFTIKVPSDFGTKKLTWTLVANAQTNTITLHTDKLWVVEPFEDPASKNTPPVIKFDPAGPAFTGPPSGIAATLTTSQGVPLGLTAWVTDEPAKLNVANALLLAPGEPLPALPGAAAGPAAAAGADGASRSAGAAPPGRGRGAGAGAGPRLPPVSVAWSVFRGPGPVAFDNARPAVDRADNGKTTASATFSTAGEYILRLQANDASGEGGGGFQCCWTNVHVGISVKPAPPGEVKPAPPEK